MLKFYDYLIGPTDNFDTDMQNKHYLLITFLCIIFTVLCVEQVENCEPIGNAHFRWNVYEEHIVITATLSSLLYKPTWFALGLNTFQNRTKEGSIIYLLHTSSGEIHKYIGVSDEKVIYIGKANNTIPYTKPVAYPGLAISINQTFDEEFSLVDSKQTILIAYHRNDNSNSLENLNKPTDVWVKQINLSREAGKFFVKSHPFSEKLRTECILVDWISSLCIRSFEYCIFINCINIIYHIFEATTPEIQRTHPLH